MNELSDLRDRILDESDRLLFDEAVKCLSTEAFRAAHIMTWLSVAESLKKKFTVMAQRDNQIGRILGKIEEFERQDRPTDKFLLDKAAEVGTITPEEARKLEHIRVMRNLYAHPTGSGPSRAEVLAALVIAVEAVLSRPPLLRHGYVTGLIRSLFEDRHFLDDIPERVRDYAMGVARRLHPDVMPHLVRRMAERLEQVVDDPESALYLRRGLEFATTVVEELNPNLSAEEWSISELIQRSPRACALILSTLPIWPRLPDQARDMILGHLIEPLKGTEISPPTSLGLRKARELAAAGLLTRRQQERLTEATNRSPYAGLKEVGVPLADYAHRLISDLSSHNWYIQNPAAEALRNAGPQECAQLEANTQEQLGRNVLQAADGTASGAESLILSILRRNETWPSAFVEGLALEGLVNDDRLFRLKERHLANALKIALAHPDVGEIFQRLGVEVSRSDPRWGWRTREYDEALTVIGNLRLEVDPTSHPYLDALSDATNASKSRAPAA